MKNTRIFTAFLAVLIVLSVLLIGCSGGSTQVPAGEEVTTTAAETVAEPEGTGLKPPSVEAEDMKGRDFHIFTSDWCSYTPLEITDICVEALDGEALNDAAFNRNREIEQLLNCTVSETADPSGQATAYTAVTKTVLAGDDVYALALMRAHQYNKVCLSGCFCDFADIPNIDMSNPWWDGGFAEAMSLGGRQIASAVDISINSYLLVAAVFYNRNMAEDYGIGDLNAMVNDGSWTLDRLYDLGKITAADIDGNGEYDNKDQYGFTYIDDCPEVLLNSFGLRLAELNSDGIPEITIYTDDAMTKIMKLSDVLQDKQTSYNCHARSKKPNEDEAGMFVRGQTLFCLGGLYYGPEMRQMDQDFGIIPYPYYDERQEQLYGPSISVAITYVTVPASNASLGETGTFMEYYGYMGRRDLLPALYDVLLQGKLARDNTSAEMLDLIFDNRVYDMGYIFDFGGLRTKMRVQYHNLQEDFASLFAANKESVQANIDEIVGLLN
ncbi:MAG: hypothetical protein GX628_01220 [Clostridiales bacterium]|nr:hypothetical protein [Clostridiales bacterium]